MATNPRASAPSGDTRARLVQIGMALFYQQGYGSVGVQEICARSGVSKSSFYHFFPSKEDLALAVIEIRWQGFVQMLEPVRQSGMPPLHKVRAVFDGLYAVSCSTLAEHGAVYGCPFGTLGGELSTSAERVRERVAEVFDRMALMFREWLAQARDAAALAAEFDIDAAARDLVTVMQGMSVVGRVYNSPERMRASGAMLIERVLAPLPIPTPERHTS